MKGEALHGVPERLLYKAVKVKPEMHWRYQDVRDARVIRYKVRRADKTV